MSNPKEKTKLLFLCTGNSCRSQIAEGWARHLKADQLEAFSAGTEPKGIHPMAMKVMEEAGVDISDQRSKHVRELIDRSFDFVLTLCGDARESCPVFPGHTRILHVGFEDPAKAEGTEKEILGVFREVRDQIRTYVEGLPDSLECDGK